jgi:cardiolipin synthase
MDHLIDELLNKTFGLPAIAGLFGWMVTVAFILNIALSVRIVWVKGFRPNAALAWIATLFALPIAGLVLYVIIGENRIGAIRRRRHAKILKEVAGISQQWRDPRVLAATMSTADTQMAHLAESSGAPEVLNGNLLQLSGDAAEQLQWIIDDINAAQQSVDVLFYIFEQDATGKAVAEALARAAQRGVKVRLLLDDIGSRAFLRSPMRTELARQGVHVTAALPASILRMIVKRVDIRNHRKLIVVDGKVAQTGSRNVADPDFKDNGTGKLGPYIDSWIRIRGPIARDLHILFMEDWGLEVGLHGSPQLPEEPAVEPHGVPVQMIPSGPNFENNVVAQLIQASIQLARREIVFTTPYFMPDSATIAAIEVAARRGLRVTLILPRANDSKLAALASRANYGRLLAAGVELWEHRHGFLHSKTISVDDELAIVTTANLDRRSYEINFETSIVAYDNAFATQLRRLQESYIANSDRVDERTWEKRGMLPRFAENLANLMSPLL